MEQQEINLILGKGIEFETVFSDRLIKWNLAKITLGKMIEFSNLFIKMKIDEEAISDPDPSIQIPTIHQSILDNARLCAEVMATAFSSEDAYKIVITEIPHRWLPKWIVKPNVKTENIEFSFEDKIQHFLDNVNSEELRDFATKLLEFSDYKNFMTSTVLMNGNRPTKAMPIEKTV